MKKNKLVNNPLQLTADQANAIVSIAEDAIISIDAEHKIIMFNHGAEIIFGYAADEILGMPLELLLPENHRQYHVNFVKDFGNSSRNARRMAERSEIEGRRKDGTLFPVEASICAIGAGDDQIFTAILRDVTQQKAYDEELRKAKETAEQADYAKSMFLANMSHEIRTPLNAVVGMTSLLLDTRLSTEQKDCAQTIRASSEALLSIINDILDYSKIEVGKLELEYQPFDLRVCIEESLDLVSSIAAEKQLNLAYMIDDSIPAVIISDITRLRQVLVNLLSNATKFTKHGEVVVSVKGHESDRNLYELQFSVSDTGIGIPADQIDQLFKSFSQLDVSTTRKYGGSGLGLAISKRLTEIMGGNMWLESQPGHGSTFHFNIKAKAGGDDLARSFMQEHAVELTAKRLLIVDDNMTNRRILFKQALLWGMVPTATASGVEAMDLIRHGHAFDVSILDMSMPEMDGLELAQQIREYRDPGSLPLIMLSSMSQRPHSQLMDELQFAAFLNKPIKASQLFMVLRASLGMEKPVERGMNDNGFDPGLAERHPLSILVAEDNAINQKVVQRLLQKFGYRPDIVVNGLEVLDALERQHYDLLLLDIQMPEMDGLEAAQKIGEHMPVEYRPRIVAMSANVQPSDRAACLAAGMDEFLAKPVELPELRCILEQSRIIPADRRLSVADNLSSDIDIERIEMIRMAQDEEEPALLASIIEMFFEESKERFTVIQMAQAQSDCSTLESEAHRFFSSCSNLGLLRMAALCTELEQRAEECGSPTVQKLINQLEQAYEKARPGLMSLKQDSQNLIQADPINSA